MTRAAAVDSARAAGRFSPYPSYKDSGVDWIGRIPADWTIRRIKFVARLESGHTPSRQHPEYWVDCTIPWFSLADCRSAVYRDLYYATEPGAYILEITDSR